MRVVPTLGVGAYVPAPIRKPLRVLFVSADPIGPGPVDWPDVKESIERAFAAEMPAGFVLDVVEGATRRSLTAHLLNAPAYDIVHFHALGPIRFSLDEIDGQNILPALDERRFDLVITRHNYLNLESYTSLEICRDKMLVVVSKKNRHAGRASISLKELSSDNVIMFDKVTGLHRLIMDECGKGGFEPTIFYSSHRKVSVFGLVGTNIGLALMPVKIYEYYRHPDVVAIPLDEEIACNIVLVHLKHRNLPKGAITFIEFMERMVTVNKN